MAEHKHHHFHHHNEEASADDVVVTKSDYTAVGNDDGYVSGYAQTTEVLAPDYEREERQHKKKEHFGELGATAAGAFALYEKHEAKKDPEHAHRHKIEEEIAAATAVGAGGYVFHEHHEKKESRKEAEETGEKKHHFF